ncbi:MAG: hypothetical protein Q7V58_11715 [Actinomycetota bacterium]|nr:hypothetical protein [Actinomycetota bacterium]
MPTSWTPRWTNRNLSTPPVQLVVAWQRGAAFEVRDVPLSRSAASSLEAACGQTLSDLQAWRAAAYSPELELDDYEYAVVRRDQLDEDSGLLQALEADDFTEIDMEDLKNRTFVAYAVMTGSPGHRLAFISRSNPTSGLRRAMFMFSDQLVAVEDPILSFDRSGADMVLEVGEGLGVLRTKAFERLFRDTPELMALTPARVAQLSTLISLSSTSRDVLTTVAARNGRVRARLYSILGRGHLAAVTPAKLRAEMRKHGLDPTRYLINGELTFDDAEVDEIMKLLNEDFTIGGLSQSPFTINRKSPR